MRKIFIGLSLQQVAKISLLVHNEIMDGAHGQFTDGQKDELKEIDKILDDFLEDNAEEVFGRPPLRSTND